MINMNFRSLLFVLFGVGVREIAHSEMMMQCDTKLNVRHLH
jgi:hypothetical protein